MRMPRLESPPASRQLRSTHMAVAVKVFAKVSLEPLEKDPQSLLRPIQLAFEVAEAVLDRRSPCSLVRDLALLDQIPEDAHGCAPAFCLFGAGSPLRWPDLG